MSEDKILVSRSLITKSASAINKAIKEKDEALEKVAAVEKYHERFMSNMSRLYKLAAREQISYESIPEFLDQLSGMSEQDQELELRALEKAANRQFLELGEVNEKPDSSGYGDPITELVMSRFGM